MIRHGKAGIRSKPKAFQAWDDGYRAGQLGRSYIPEADYRTSEEWLAFLAGYRQGQKENESDIRRICRVPR